MSVNDIKSMGLLLLVGSASGIGTDRDELCLAAGIHSLVFVRMERQAALTDPLSLPGTIVDPFIAP